MDSYKEFEQEFQEVLRHLHDPDYQPREALCAAIGCDFANGMAAVQAAVFRAIEILEPPPNTPPTASTKQVYNLLYNRFVLGLTQEETAYQLKVSRRTVNRLQHRAAHALAGALWRHSQTLGQVARGLPQGDDELPAEETPAVTPISDWHSQMQRELDSLQAKAPDAWCDVEEAINSVLGFVSPLASELGIRLEVKSVQPGLVATIHPVLLHQVLLSALRRFAPYVSDGQVAVYARLEDGNAKITLTGATTVSDGLDEKEFARGIPISKDVSIKVCVDGTQAFVWINVPSMGKVTVLVVDDNEDMARFFRDSAIGTRYHIVHVAQGRELPEAIEATAPDVIVLDVMLPDIDGWRLLMRLHEDPATRSIPVIICSVVQEEDLALSLGAAHYLPKPVRPREFIQALDQVLPLVPAIASISPGSSVEAY
jgi:CheY-like chemotaxis protein/transcriptional regulator with XRE-family HTH domain